LALGDVECGTSADLDKVAIWASPGGDADSVDGGFGFWFGFGFFFYGSVFVHGLES
jgi:hypothetical protein